MKSKLWGMLILGLMVLLLASSLGTTTSYFVDSETCAGNTFQAWTSTQWVQTTQADFEAGVPGNVSTSTSPGLVKLAKGSPNQLYAFRGASADYWRYDIAENSWTEKMADSPGDVGAGGALAYDGANYIYAFRGGTTTTFWRYDIAENSWTEKMAGSPGDVGAGGALAYNGSNYIYAFRGGTTTTFWRYDIAENSWTEKMADFPGDVGAGGALALVIPYVGSGTIASQVLDTGAAGATWDELSWDETLPTNSDITFEVRASNTSFAKDTPPETLPWTSVEGTSPVTSGLPSGRYMQWRATLTTSDTSKTPTLLEVRVYYY